MGRTTRTTRRRSSPHRSRRRRRLPSLRSQPKPKPKPILNICRVLKVTPGMVKASGKAQIVLAKVTRSRNPVQRCRRQVLRQWFREGRHDEQAGHCPSDAHPEQGGDHAREDHEREGVQQRPHRRCRRLRAAGDGLGDPPSRHSGRCRRRPAWGHRCLGMSQAGPQGPVGPYSRGFSSPASGRNRKALHAGIGAGGWAA